MAPVTQDPSLADVRVVGRYALHREIASGGMATVHVGRLLGPAGFSRTVAIKRLHENFAKDPEFVAMFMDEARLAARIQHPNVVPIIDVVAADGELLLIMDYIQGESLSRLNRATIATQGCLDPKLAARVMCDVLNGLHAAHEARNERGEHLGLVHRDVSPQNILVGIDGLARIIDFGVAKAVGRISSTRDGQVKGKVGYMAPDIISGGPPDRRTDVYSAAVVMWELLAGERLFKQTDVALMFEVIEGKVRPPSHVHESVPATLDSIVLKGLSKSPADRFATALEMAEAIESAVTPATMRDVSCWVDEMAKSALEQRARHVAVVESSSYDSIQVVGAKKHPSETSSAYLTGQPLDPPTLTSSTLSTRQAGLTSGRARLVGILLALACVAAIVFALVLRKSDGSGSTIHAAPAVSSSTVSADSAPSASAASVPAPADTASAPMPESSGRSKPALGASKIVAPASTTQSKKSKDYGF
jgi:serine/threonine-protein kinase